MEIQEEIYDLQNQILELRLDYKVLNDKVAILQGNDNKSYLKPELSQVIDYLNLRSKQGFRHVKPNIKHVNARFKEGISVELMKKVIDLKVKDWLGDEKWEKYLRPSTLFNAEKCENYVTQVLRKEGRFIKRQEIRKELDEIEGLSPEAKQDKLDSLTTEEVNKTLERAKIEHPRDWFKFIRWGKR